MENSDTQTIIAEDALERGRKELKARLDEMDALPYTVPKKNKEIRENRV